MPFIETTTDPADDVASDLFEADRERLGYVANYTRLFALRPAVYEAWSRLRRVVTESMDPRRYELATLAAARTLRSSYCLLGHGKVLRDRFYDAEALRRIVTDHRSAGLDDVDVAIMDFAEQVAADATSVTQSDVDRLRELGLTDTEVLDVALAAAARCFFSKTLDALGVDADEALSELEPDLVEALAIGRPFEER
jgi:uncharacterized peroxidase-related enzyme